jgi:hypothetical protein
MVRLVGVRPRLQKHLHHRDVPSLGGYVQWCNTGIRRVLYFSPCFEKRIHH